MPNNELLILLYIYYIIFDIIYLWIVKNIVPCCQQQYEAWRTPFIATMVPEVAVQNLFQQFELEVRFVRPDDCATKRPVSIRPYIFSYFFPMLISTKTQKIFWKWKNVWNKILLKLTTIIIQSFASTRVHLESWKERHISSKILPKITWQIRSH